MGYSTRAVVRRQPWVLVVAFHIAWDDAHHCKRRLAACTYLSSHKKNTGIADAGFKWDLNSVLHVGLVF